MILKTTVLLISLIWCVQATEHVPVRLFEVKNMIIDGYTGPLTATSLELLKDVESLTFQNCNFSVSNYNCLNPVKNLKKLVLINSRFGVIEDDPSVCCEKLVEVEMVDSSAGPMPVSDFKMTAAIESLKRLYLTKLEIPLFTANAFAGSNVKVLEITHSGLTTIEDGALNGMARLEVLDFQGNNLTTIPTASLAAVKTLKEINLEKNHFVKLTADDIPALPNLEKLKLGHNPIKEVNLIGLKAKLPKIKEIDLSGIEVDQAKTDGLPILKAQID